MQKLYGKTQAELETLVEGFSWALEDYEMSNIIEAFRIYIRNKSDIPAPADIIAILEKKREYDLHVPPSIDDLKRYKSKGIPLSKEQQIMLDNA